MLRSPSTGLIKSFGERVDTLTMPVERVTSRTLAVVILQCGQCNQVAGHQISEEKATERVLGAFSKTKARRVVSACTACSARRVVPATATADILARALAPVQAPSTPPAAPGPGGYPMLPDPSAGMAAAAAAGWQMQVPAQALSGPVAAGVAAAAAPPTVPLIPEPSPAPVTTYPSFAGPAGQTILPGQG